MDNLAQNELQNVFVCHRKVRYWHHLHLNTNVTQLNMEFECNTEKNGMHLHIPNVDRIMQCNLVRSER